MSNSLFRHLRIAWLIAYAVCATATAALVSKVYMTSTTCTPMANDPTSFEAVDAAKMYCVELMCFACAKKDRNTV